MSRKLACTKFPRISPRVPIHLFKIWASRKAAFGKRVFHQGGPVIDKLLTRTDSAVVEALRF